MMYQEIKTSNLNIDDISAPIAAIDLDEFIDLINEKADEDDEDVLTLSDDSIDNDQDERRRQKQRKVKTKSQEADLCNSLEDLVKTFDQNVKKCLSNYKDVDVGQLAPVQVRSQEDIMHDSQLWYTLTGNFGNLLPIDYWSKSLARKYHTRALGVNKRRKDEFNSDYDLNDLADSDDNDDNDDGNDDEDEDEEEAKSRNDEYEEDNMVEFEDDEEEEEELREQLDMHSMILAKSSYAHGELDEPLITAEQVLNEIDSMMMMQVRLFYLFVYSFMFYFSIDMKINKPK